MLDYTHMTSYPKIGLALGSGGPRGLAHVGIIKVLLEHNIPIDYVTGASIGALIGGIYALDNDINAVEQMLIANDWKKVMSLFTPAFGQGFIGGNNVMKYLREQVGEKTFKDLKTPLTILATDIRHGKAVEIREGKLASAIRASTSIPVLFEPTKRDGKLLADAGLSVPVPVETARAMGAQFVIAVNLDADYFSHKKTGKTLSLYDIADNSIMTLRQYLAAANTHTADFVLEPRVGKAEWTEFADAKKGIREGEKFMRAKLPELLRALESFGNKVC